MYSMCEFKDYVYLMGMYNYTYLQFHLGLLKPLFVTSINDEDYGINCREIVFPHPPRRLVTTEVKGDERDPSYRHLFLC
jgi:hypothetical protein